jgi:hypothetical protein
MAGGARDSSAALANLVALPLMRHDNLLQSCHFTTMPGHQGDGAEHQGDARFLRSQNPRNAPDAACADVQSASVSWALTTSSASLIAGSPELANPLVDLPEPGSSWVACLLRPLPLTDHAFLRLITPVVVSLHLS